MNSHIERFIHLKQLGLRNVNLSRDDVQTMVSVVTRAPALREVDISSNKLTASELSILVSRLTPHN